MKKLKLSEILELYRSFIKPYIFIELQVLFLIILSTFFTLSSPFIFKLIIDKSLMERNKQLLFILVTCFIIAYIMQSVCQILKIKRISYLRNKLDYDLSIVLYKKIVHQEPHFFHNIHTGDLIQRVMSEVTDIKHIFTDALINLLTQSMIFITVFIILLFMNFELALLTLLSTPLIFLHFNYFNYRLKNVSKEIRVETSRLTNILHDQIQGIEVIKSYHREKTSVLLFSKGLHSVIKKYVNATYLEVLNGQFLSLIYIFAPLALFIYGGLLVINQRISIGSFVAFYTYVTRLYDPIRTMANINVTLQKAQVALERFLEIVKSPENKLPYLNKSRLDKKIDIRNIGFSYQDGEKVFDNFSATFEIGQIIALVGKNGSGKSTLMKILANVYKITYGEILFDSVSLSDISPRNKKKLIGFVPQTSFLFNNTILYNITFEPWKTNMAQIEKLAKVLNIHDYINNLKAGYFTSVEGHGDDFSGGQKQKITILRALYNDPSVILLDEATSALDKISESYLFQYLNSIKRDKIIIFTSHTPELLEFADKVIDLDRCN